VSQEVVMLALLDVTFDRIELFAWTAAMWL
jgi:hypothetical protein